MVKKIEIVKEGYRCERCNHEWVPTSDAKPLVCPKCKSPYWFLARRE
jgi:Zn finger protein HypA/HybF involved in hydrogenase expression